MVVPAAICTFFLAFLGHHTYQKLDVMVGRLLILDPLIVALSDVVKSIRHVLSYVQVRLNPGLEHLERHDDCLVPEGVVLANDELCRRQLAQDSL